MGRMHNMAEPVDEAAGMNESKIEQEDQPGK
jgi:hypothetical protein